MVNIDHILKPSLLGSRKIETLRILAIRKVIECIFSKIPTTTKSLPCIYHIGAWENEVVVAPAHPTCKSCRVYRIPESTEEAVECLLGMLPENYPASESKKLSCLIRGFDFYMFLCE